MHGGTASVGSQDRQRETPDDLSVLLAALPPEIVEALHALPDREALIEVVLDLGRRPCTGPAPGRTIPGHALTVTMVAGRATQTPPAGSAAANRGVVAARRSMVRMRRSG